MKGSIQKYQTKKGTRYRFTVDITSDGERKQKKQSGFLKKKDAELALRKLLAQVDEGNYIEPSKEPFETYINDWFHTHYKKRIKVTTQSNRRYIVEKHLIKENPFSQKALSKVSTQDVDSLYNLKLDDGYSTNYIRKMHQILNLAFSQAVKWNKIRTNPVKNASPPSVEEKEVTIWSNEEIHTFLKHCSGERLYIMFFLAIYTGMRRGELLGLKWSNINFKDKYIEVSQTLSYVENKGYLFSEPKTLHSKRKVPISKLVLKELLRYKEKQEKQKRLLGSSYYDQDLVICTDLGKVQNPRNVIRTMKRIIKKSGVNDIRFHDLRHLHASILISERVDIVKVSSRLGHSNPRTTLGIYAHLVPNLDSDVAEIFENVLENPVTDM